MSDNVRDVFSIFLVGIAAILDNKLAYVWRYNLVACLMSQLKEVGGTVL